MRANSLDFKVLYDQKTKSDEANCTLGGKSFQTRAAATGNARSPIVVRVYDAYRRDNHSGRGRVSQAPSGVEVGNSVQLVGEV